MQLKKKKKTDCLLKDLKVIEKQSGKKGKRRTKHVKAEITGYPRIISVCVYLGLPWALSSTISQSLDYNGNLKTKPSVTVVFNWSPESLINAVPQRAENRLPAITEF